MSLGIIIAMLVIAAVVTIVGLLTGMKLKEKVVERLKKWGVISEAVIDKKRLITWIRNAEKNGETTHLSVDQLDALDKIAADLRELSGRMGENIYENVMDGIEIHEKLDAAREERKEERKEQLTELRLQAEELRGRYRELAERSIRDGRRIVRAFPTMQSRRHKELLERIRARVHEGK